MLRVGKGRNFRIAEEELKDYEERNTQPLSIETILASQVELSHEEFCKIYEKPTGGGKSKSAGKSKKGGSLMSEKKSPCRRNFGFGRIIPRKNKSGEKYWRWDIEYKGVATKGKAKGKYGWIHEVCPEAVNEKMATEALLKAVRRQHELKISPERVAQQDRASIIFSQLAERYHEQHAKLEKRNPENGKYIVDAYLVPQFGAFDLDADYDDAIASYKAKRLKDGRKKQTINQELALARAIFGWAKKQKKYGIVENPFSSKFFKVGDNKRTRILNDHKEEEGKLLAVLPTHTRDMSYNSLRTLMRKSEILNLRWPQLELEDRRIKLEVEDNKGKRVEFVPLCEDMVREFERLKNLNGKSPTGYVYLYNDRPIKNIKSSWTTALEKAGIENLHFHDLRRTGATRLLKRGANIVTIQKILRHKNIQTTIIYLSIGEEDKHEAIELLSDSKIENTQNIRKTQNSEQPFVPGVGFYPIESQGVRS